MSSGACFSRHRALALMALNDELMNRGVVMRIHEGDITNETSDSSCEEAHHVLDVTFVDDECIMLAADDSRSLADAIDCCILVLSTTFQLLKLEVNWRPGKTECLVQMRGKQGRDIVEKWRREDGSLSIPVPQCDTRINVVDRYRHLGTIVMANGNDMPNARLRWKSAKEAYGPLALRIFGSGHILAPLKLSLCIVTQLLFDAHCTTVIQRLSDCCFCVQPSSAQDGSLSVPTSLVVMLSIRIGDPLAPPEVFVRVQEDLHFAWKTVAVLASAPPPDLGASFWVGVMRDKERWAQIVKSVHFFESALDNRASMKRSKACVCSVCNQRFASELASAAHAQRVHWYRTEWSKRVTCGARHVETRLVTSQSSLRRFSRSTERLTLLRSAPPALTARCVQVGSHGCDRPYATSLTEHRMATWCITRLVRGTSLM